MSLAQEKLQPDPTKSNPNSI